MPALLFNAITVLLWSTVVIASSSGRNPLSAVTVIKDASIHTNTQRVHAHSSFDISFLQGPRRIKLSLEPNHDIIPAGATVTYLDVDGEVRSQEAIERLDHRVYKGVTWLVGDDAVAERAGLARIVVRRDGSKPLFEGSFDISHNHHHIQLLSHYLQTRHERDSLIDFGLGSTDQEEEDHMVVYRDSDLEADSHDHLDLRRRGMDQQQACAADQLTFNGQPEHPLYAGMSRKDDSLWALFSPNNVFSKRQLDNIGGTGNSGVINLAVSIGKTDGCPSSRRVALVGVATDCGYTAAFGSSEAVRQNVITQINSASSLFEQTFKISLGLQNLTVSDGNCPSSPATATPWNRRCSSDATIQTRLNDFSQWRGNQQDSNSHWTLLTTCNTGSEVGLSWLGQTCVTGSHTANSSNGVETVSGANVAARTSTEWQVIAHETGHTFGAVHDCTDQTCNDGTSVKAQQCCPLSSSACDAGERYIMNPSTSQGITNFSPCSIGNICSAMGRNSIKTTCFSNNKDVVTITGQQCGNGIVEPGEDCDCGGAADCGNNSCCDAKTCKFKSGATCDDSNDACCASCQFAPSSKVCRASTGECDPEERCSGSSSACPNDNLTQDGQKCGDGSDSSLQCTSGQCTSRDRQCKTVMGSLLQGNDTYACDGLSCTVACSSPQFGTGVCYSLQQNFLDGTICYGNGRCQNGDCKGATIGGEINSWIHDHKAIVIGLSCALGIFFLFGLFGCLRSLFQRRRFKKTHPAPWPPTSSPHPHPHPPLYNQQQQQQQQHYNPSNAAGPEHTIAPSWLGFPPAFPPPSYGNQPNMTRGARYA